MHWAFSGVTFHFCRNLAVGYNLRKPSVTACCFRRKVLFDMYAIQRPATLKWLRTQQSCGPAVFSIALCDTCVMRCTSQAVDFVANCNSLDLFAISSSQHCICFTDPSHFPHSAFDPFSVSNCNNKFYDILGTRNWWFHIYVKDMICLRKIILRLSDIVHFFLLLREMHFWE